MTGIFIGCEEESHSPAYSYDNVCLEDGGRQRIAWTIGDITTPVYFQHVPIYSFTRIAYRFSSVYSNRIDANRPCPRIQKDCTLE